MMSRTLTNSQRPMRTALLTLAILAAGAAPAAASDPADEPFSTDTVAETHRSAHPEMTAAQARLAAGEAHERDALVRLLGEQPATFGGAWYDPPTNVLHVNATTPAAVDDAERLGETKDLDVRGHLVARSFDQLERQAGTLRSGAGVLSAAAKGQVGLDVRANKVVIAVSAEQRPALLGAANAANVKLIVDPKLAVEPDACAARDVCDNGLAPGAIVRPAVGNLGCSMGFTTDDTFTGSRFAFTAGHCSNGLNVTWSTGAQSIGPLVSAMDLNEIDASLIQVTNATYTGQPGGRLYNTDDVDSVVNSLSSIVEGEVVCKAANFQDPNGPRYCGEIDLVSDPNVRGMVRVREEDACGGDSGGPWYRLIDGITPKLRIAYGLHSRSDFGCRGDSGGTESWFSSLPSIKAAFAPTHVVETR